MQISLRKIAAYYSDPELTEAVEAFIDEETPGVEEVLAEIRPRLEGKTVMMYVGGSRAHHYQELFNELGMKVLSAGYEFAHRDDYEGRKVLPSIVVDADSRNIEELKIQASETEYNPRPKPDGIEFRDYKGMMPEMDEGALVIDDISHHETEKLIELFHPDLLCAGIKEKYVVQKHGIPLKQLHNYDIGGPYTGFEGAKNFYREIDRLVNGSVWKALKAPWQTSPQLSGAFVTK